MAEYHALNRRDISRKPPNIIVTSGLNRSGTPDGWRSKRSLVRPRRSARRSECPLGARRTPLAWASWPRFRRGSPWGVADAVVYVTSPVIGSELRAQRVGLPADVVQNAPAVREAIHLPLNLIRFAVIWEKPSKHLRQRRGRRDERHWCGSRMAQRALAWRAARLGNRVCPPRCVQPRTGRVEIAFLNPGRPAFLRTREEAGRRLVRESRALSTYATGPDTTVMNSQKSLRTSRYGVSS